MYALLGGKTKDRLPVYCTTAKARPHLGYTLGRTSAAPRLILGCTSAAPRLHLGCTSAAPRPHLGCTSAAPRLQGVDCRLPLVDPLPAVALPLVRRQSRRLPLEGEDHGILFLCSDQRSRGHMVSCIPPIPQYSLYSYPRLHAVLSEYAATTPSSRPEAGGFSTQASSSPPSASWWE